MNDQGGSLDLTLTSFLVVADQDRSRAWYRDVLGAKVVRPRDPVILTLGGGTLILNDGGEPTPDKPDVVLEVPADPQRVSAFLNLRTPDIATVHRATTQRGARWLTEPINRGPEIRGYLRDPDGHLVEIGQSTARPSQTPSPTLKGASPPPASHRDLLDGDHFAHLATLRPDGGLQSQVVWFEYDPDGRHGASYGSDAGVLRITSGDYRQKVRNALAHPQVALSIADPANPYRTLEVRGTAVTAEPDPTGALFDRLAARHGFTREPADRAQRVALVINPDRWVTFG